jgi:hypothetical protein
VGTIAIATGVYDRRSGCTYVMFEVDLSLRIEIVEPSGRHRPAVGKAREAGHGQ